MQYYAVLCITLCSNEKRGASLGDSMNCMPVGQYSIYELGLSSKYIKSIFNS